MPKITAVGAILSPIEPATAHVIVERPNHQAIIWHIFFNMYVPLWCVPDSIPGRRIIHSSWE